MLHKLGSTRRQSALLLIISTFLFHCTVSADPKPTVYYAGVACLGDYQYIQTNYPFAYQLSQPLAGQTVGQLDKHFKALIEKEPNPSFNLALELANYKKGPAIVMSLAIEKEHYSLEKFSDYDKIITEVSAQLLFFDFQSMQLVASYPISIASNDVMSGDRGNPQALRKKLAQNFADLYMGADKNLMTLARDRLPQIRLKQDNALRFKVDTVNFSEQAISHLPQPDKAPSYAQIIGQYFTAQLDRHADIAVLPYIKGYAIGNKMSARMANGDVYTLALPAPDYVFDVEVSNFKNLHQDNSQLFASRLKLALREPLSDDIIVNDYFHYAVAKLVGREQHSIDAWSAYEDAIEALLTEFSQQLPKPNKKWFSLHSSSTENFKKIKRKRDLFNEI